MLVVNVPRMLCYLSLLGLSIWGEIPWWVLPVLIAYDHTWVTWFRLPWVKPGPPRGGEGEPEAVTLQQMLQMKAMIEKAKETSH